MLIGNGIGLPLLGFASCFIFIYIAYTDFRMDYIDAKDGDLRFVRTNGTQFMLNEKAFYVNGWNYYWLMDQAVEEHSRMRVSSMLKVGANMGLTVCRTWAFNDGAYNALQISPGQFDERVFKALDYVIAEARIHGIRLILSLVNDLQAFGGKTQYVKWALQEGIALSTSNDEFFSDPYIRKYFKTYVKTILTRKNSYTGIEYKNDPTIFAWELINEPRCTSDPSGDTLQDWIKEMAAFVKSIDKNHLVTVGLEGFYGPTESTTKLSVNPGNWASKSGSDFLRNSKISNIDFTSVHIYPDHWFKEQTREEKLKYVEKWVVSHIDDGDRILKKPVLFTEFGLSDKNINFEHSHRDTFYKMIYDIVYKSATNNGAGAGTLVWQLLVEGMNEYNDDFGIIPGNTSTIYRVITQQSCKLATIHKAHFQSKKIYEELCFK
ncbi:hypothetical protein MKX03_018628 [Papaver bracteatum]|nr:hypothetical protein MKX03_018628 [Papaver bracteatum]